MIASLTRSNDKGDIGFMKASERLNVLISRARNGLIMIGNMATFMNSPQGKDTWTPFFKLLKEKEYLKDGLHVRCERHPSHTAMLSTPQDFDRKCPDGGCTEPCTAVMRCGKHKCQQRCHRLKDHGKMTCGQTIEKTCEKEHFYKVKCAEEHLRCPKCQREEDDIRRRARRDLELEKARVARQERYRCELKEVQDEIAREQRLLKEERESQQEKSNLQQLRADLEGLKETKRRQQAMKNVEDMARSAESSTTDAPDSGDKKHGSKLKPGSPEEEWDDLKRTEPAKSDAIDNLMEMIGLEEVKREFLNIKSTVDTAARQQVSTKSERFGCRLLGNPGTGRLCKFANPLSKMLTLAIG